MTTHNLQLLEEYPGKVFRCENHRVVEQTAENSENLASLENPQTIENNQ